MEQFNYLDIIILFILFWGLVGGLIKGFIMELISIVALVVGIVAAKIWAPPFQVWMAQWIEMPDWLAKMLAYLLIFIVATLLCQAIGKLVKKAIHAVALGWLDRLAGGLFGVFETALIISVVLNLFVILEQFVQIIPSDLQQQSSLYSLILRLASVSWTTVTSLVA